MFPEWSRGLCSLHSSEPAARSEGLIPLAQLSLGSQSPLTPFRLFSWLLLLPPDFPCCFQSPFWELQIQGNNPGSLCFSCSRVVTPGAFCQGALPPAPVSWIPGKPCLRNGAGKATVLINCLQYLLLWFWRWATKSTCIFVLCRELLL